MQSKYVVVGAGLMGAATAWRLAQRGHEVTLVERTEPAARDGSSHGSGRIFRYAYPDPFYAAMVVRVRGGFEELEQLSGRELLTRTGALDFGSTRDPRRLAAVLDEVGVANELLSAAEVRRRFPQIRLDGDALWHPDAGVIDAQGTVMAMVAAFTVLGGRLLTSWPVTSVERIGTGLRVHGPEESIDAEQVVITAGGWLPDLTDRLPLSASFRSRLPRIEVSQENAFHFPYRDIQDTWPTFILKDLRTNLYSLPGGRDAGFGGQKIAEFNTGRKMASASAQDGVVDPAARGRLTDFVRNHLPGLVPSPYASTTCLFTNIRSEDFLLDRDDGVTLVSPCSGHGAKFTPLIGDLVADVVTGASDPPDRFTVEALAAAGNG